MPLMGSWRRRKLLGSVVPNRAVLSWTSGSNVCGTPNIEHSCGSKSPASRSKSSVRLALLASVTTAWPPVSRATNQASTVPAHSSPRSARARKEGSSRNSHSILVAVKYGSRSRPVRRRTSASSPFARCSAQMEALRLHCHTIAGATGSSVRRSNSTTVSR